MRFELWFAIVFLALILGELIVLRCPITPSLVILGIAAVFIGWVVFLRLYIGVEMSAKRAVRDALGAKGNLFL